MNMSKGTDKVSRHGQENAHYYKKKCWRAGRVDEDHRATQEEGRTADEDPTVIWRQAANPNTERVPLWDDQYGSHDLNMIDGAQAHSER